MNNLVDDITAEAEFHFPIHRPHHVGPLVSTPILLIIISSDLPLLVNVVLRMLFFLVIVLRMTCCSSVLNIGSLFLSYFRISIVLLNCFRTLLLCLMR